MIVASSVIKITGDGQTTGQGTFEFVQLPRCGDQLCSGASREGLKSLRSAVSSTTRLCVSLIPQRQGWQRKKAHGPLCTSATSATKDELTTKPLFRFIGKAGLEHSQHLGPASNLPLVWNAASTDAFGTSNTYASVRTALSG